LRKRIGSSPVAGTIIMIEEGRFHLSLDRIYNYMVEIPYVKDSLAFAVAKNNYIHHPERFDFALSYKEKTLRCYFLLEEDAIRYWSKFDKEAP
jgi:hypothetical protein